MARGWEWRGQYAEHARSQPRTAAIRLHKTRGRIPAYKVIIANGFTLKETLAKVTFSARMDTWLLKAFRNPYTYKYQSLLSWAAIADGISLFFNQHSLYPLCTHTSEKALAFSAL